MKLDEMIDPFAPASSPPPRKLGKFINWCLSGSYKPLGIGAGISSLAGITEVSTALFLGMVIDAALAGDPSSFFSGNSSLLLIALLFLIVLRPILLGLSALMQSVVIAPGVFTQVLTRLNRWTLGQTVTFFDNDFAGRISQKQMQAAGSITEVVVETLNTLVFAATSVIGAAVVITDVDYRITLVFGLWLVMYWLFLRHYLPRVRVRARARAGARTGVTGQLVDTISNIKTVKLFAHVDHEDRAAIQAMKEFRAKATHFGYLSAQFRFGLMIIAGILPVVMVGATLFFWTQGTASTGDIATTGSLAIRFAQMTGWVSFTLMGVFSHVGEIEDGMNTLTVRPVLVDADTATELAVPRGEIQFEGVTFAYGGKTGGISKTNLTIRAGEKLGIVGASGAGKSTLVSLLLRLYDPEKGRVLIDGQDLSKVTQKSLRRQIGMVTQETAMFNRSAMDNIMYGKPDAGEHEVVDAAQRAEAHGFIQDLVDYKGREGYGAFLGERGVKLSGGQRQRVALARAILKDAPILVLDEATSALDSEVEAAIQTALENVMEGKTVLAIAHRLSTIAKMDRIIVLDQGRVVEQGTHSELLEQNGMYAQYWNRQSGGFIGIEETAR
ncbi:ABC transporter ATP-binding protein [Falsihalocynthiibacter arcticus]|uniref:Multidrug ABC transporter ATP-binding protein n=1 Tax=Falsihalocynthiibacter arcticus TaxID=1579316 RepID=A0A126UXU6_9RHOB|nr:ABC transporter ATP-binding protein [Falsihalocynthiibacter arcticus]AML50888.1 multidrug ABC transporter ATP-binding protein [Falsihalocynthiibacter arcticus]